MKKLKKLIIMAFLGLLILPLSIEATGEYNETTSIDGSKFKDILASVVGRNVNEDKLTIYFFHGDGCPHCADEEEFFKSIEKKYKNYIEIVKYEVWYNEANSKLMSLAKKRLLSSSNGVPFTVIGNKHFSGYSKGIGSQMENLIKEYLSFKGNDVEIENTINLPVLGDVDAQNVSIPLVAIILGTIDGFNPCAMWVLLFLINMLFGMKDKKRMWILGISFLLTSGVVYFFAMLGISAALSIASVIWIRRLIAVVAIIGGILNLRSYLRTSESGCEVVDDKKRKKMFARIKKFTTEKSFVLALIGVIVLAFSVNLVELACSLGFPAIFSSILSINDITGSGRVFYLLLYTLFFLIDDLVIFIIAMSTFKLTGISTKYNKYSHLVGGLIMVLMGILLIFKPEWLMFNFS